MVRRCCCLLAGLFCWLFLPGCISVDIETKAERNLSGIRSYKITLEPMLARVYRLGPSAGMFNLPGQDLERQKGVNVVSKLEKENQDGSLELAWSYKASRLDDFSAARDTVRFSKRHNRWWIYYSYYERHLPRGDSSAPGLGESLMRNHLFLPGQILSSNGDSLDGSGVVWLRSMAEISREGLTMVAESREINQLCVITVLLIVVIFVAVYGIRGWIKSTGLPNIKT